jgi:hypothetical protein
MNTKYRKGRKKERNANYNFEYEPLKTDRDTERQFSENRGV